MKPLITKKISTPDAPQVVSQSGLNRPNAPFDCSSVWWTTTAKAAAARNVWIPFSSDFIGYSLK
jgi:hypothetical protein